MLGAQSLVINIEIFINKDVLSKANGHQNVLIHLVVFSWKLFMCRLSHSIKQYPSKNSYKNALPSKAKIVFLGKRKHFLTLYIV